MPFAHSSHLLFAQCLHLAVKEKCFSENNHIVQMSERREGLDLIVLEPLGSFQVHPLEFFVLYCLN